jgi:hypothetical protein
MFYRGGDKFWGHDVPLIGSSHYQHALPPTNDCSLFDGRTRFDWNLLQLTSEPHGAAGSVCPSNLQASSFKADDGPSAE